MDTQVETVPRPTHRARDSGTVDEKAGQGAGRIAVQARPPSLKELAAQVLARAATRDSTRDDDRDTARSDCPTAPDLVRAVGQSPPFAADVEWREYFEERAAIREHDGGLSRTDADAGALADCVARWRALNPLPASDDSACIHCGRARPDTVVLARDGHAWLHRECWVPMNAERNHLARRAVEEVLGLPRPHAEA